MASPGSAITLIQRYINGTYQNGFDTVALFDDGFHDNQTEIIVDWQPTGKSTLRSRLTWIDRQHEHFAQRDYDGWRGDQLVVVPHREIAREPARPARYHHVVGSALELSYQ